MAWLNRATSSKQFNSQLFRPGRPRSSETFRIARRWLVMTKEMNHKEQNTGSGTQTPPAGAQDEVSATNAPNRHGHDPAKNSRDIGASSTRPSKYEREESGMTDKSRP